MADVNKSVEISLRANLSQMKKGLKELPGMTKKEAEQMVKALEGELKKSERAAKKAAKTNKRALKEMKRQADKTAAAFRAMSKQLATGAVAGGVAVVAFTQHLADLSNQIVDSSTKTGIATETLAGLRLAAEGSGLAFENLEAGLNKLPSQMLKVQQGSKGISKTFDRLGVSVEESKNGMLQLRDADAVLKDLFVSLNNVTSAEEKAALASEIFGRTAGPQLIQSGAIANMEKFVSFSKEFGISTGPQMVSAMAEYQRVSSAALQTVTGEAQRLMDTFTGSAEGGGMSAAIMRTTETFIFLSTVVSDVFKGIVSTVQFGGSMAGAAIEGLRGNWSEAMIALREDAQTAREEGIDNMFDTLERGTQRINKFRTAVSETMKAGEAGAGGAGGAGQDDATEKAKKQQAILKGNLELSAYTRELEAQSAKFAQSKLDLQLEELQGNDQLEEQVRRRAAAIDEELVALQEKEQALMGNLEIDFENAEQEKELNALTAALIQREKDLELEKHELFRSLTVDTSELELDYMDQLMAKDEEVNKSRIENREKLAEKERELLALQQATSQLVLSSISDTATIALSIAEGSYEKNKGLVMTLFRVQQAAAIAQIGFNTSTAIMGAFDTYKQFAPIAIAGIIATSAAQVAQVMTQKPPKLHTGGIVGGAPDEVPATLLSGEGVLSRETVQRIGGEEGLRDLEEGSQGVKVIVMNPYKHFDRFQRDRSLMGIDSNQTGRRGY